MPAPTIATDEKSSLLSPDHERLLREVSGIDQATIIARGYRTITSHAEIQRLGFGRGQCPTPVLLIPIHDVNGERVLYQARPDQPRVNREGRLAKYEVPRGSRLVIDVPPTIRAHILSPAAPLVVTLGVRSADAAASRGIAAVGLLGPLGWKHQDQLWKRLSLEDRIVRIAWNSGTQSDPQTALASEELARFLGDRGARVRLLAVPELPDGRIQGLDEWLSGGNTLDDLPQLQVPTQVTPAHPVDNGSHPYRRTEAGLAMDECGREGEVYSRQLTNFDASITAEVVVSDGAEERRELEIQATVAGSEVAITLDAAEFAAMGWVVPKLGAMAVLTAGEADIKDHTRAAIQTLSGQIRKIRVFTHLGWVRVDGIDLYLHATGFIGANFAAQWDIGKDGRPSPKLSRFNEIAEPGPQGSSFRPDELVQCIGVRAPDALGLFQLPSPPTGDELVGAVRDSLSLVKIAPDTLSLPLYAAVWRAALGDSRFSIALDGGTGNGKSTFVALFQQHFGPGMDHDHLPAGWSSTVNFMERLCFAAKDCLVTADDLVLRGSQADADRANRDADRFFRGQGNGIGRGRCSTDGSMRPVRPSRCLPVCTQEEAPSGHSLSARVLRLDVGKGDVLAPAKLENLTRHQELAANGQFAKAMAGFVAYLAADLDGFRELLREQKDSLREIFRSDGRHARTASIAAELTAGFNIFLNFARTVGAIGEDEYADYWSRIHDALREKAEDQHRHLSTQEPVNQFLNCLHSAIAAGHCHLASRLGDAPDSRPDAWGWREETIFVAKSPLPVTLQTDRPAPQPAQPSDAVEERSKWRCRGVRIGWVVLEKVYLLPEAALGVAQKVAHAMGHRLAIQYQSLGRMLSDAGLLLERDRSRGRFTKRINAQGGRHNTYCLDGHILVRREFHLVDFAEADYDGPKPSIEEMFNNLDA